MGSAINGINLPYPVDASSAALGQQQWDCRVVPHRYHLKELRE